MRKLVLLAVMLMVLSIGVYAQQPVRAFPTPEIATYPGAILLTEVNMSDADVLGMAKQAITVFAESTKGAKGEVGKYIKAANLDSLSAAIEGVQAVRAMQFKMPVGTTPEKVLNFYAQSFTSDQGWARVLYDVTMIPKGAVAIYTRGGQEYFIVGADTARSRIYVERIAGSVDVPKLASWAGGLVKTLSELEAKYMTPKPTAVKKPVAKTPVKKTVKKPTRR